MTDILIKLLEIQNQIKGARNDKRRKSKEVS
nr:MAG TPA: hypothetical protein [Caudoviricetes sp.]